MWSNTRLSLNVWAKLRRMCFKVRHSSTQVFCFFSLDQAVWANYNNSLTWNKAMLGWFLLLTMIPVRSQWGRYNLPSIQYMYWQGHINWRTHIEGSILHHRFWGTPIYGNHHVGLSYGAQCSKLLKFLALQAARITWKPWISWRSRISAVGCRGPVGHPTWILSSMHILIRTCMHIIYIIFIYILYI